MKNLNWRIGPKAIHQKIEATLINVILPMEAKASMDGNIKSQY
jgi:hypothetical protein